MTEGKKCSIYGGGYCMNRASIGCKQCDAEVCGEHSVKIANETICVWCFGNNQREEFEDQQLLAHKKHCSNPNCDCRHY